MADTEEIVQRLRRLGTDVFDVEVKAAAGGLPKSIPETLSAFANGEGGTVLLGLDEERGFVGADGFQAGRIRDAFVTACTDAVTPALRIPIDIEEFEGRLLVRADIQGLDPLEKPCYVTARGEYQGSFIRSGDGDLKLTHYEVTQLLSNRTQPLYDREMVGQADIADLDSDLTERVAARVRRNAPRSFTGRSVEDILVMLGALARDGDTVRPTLAGLLCLGAFPQQYFPQLFVSFVVMPGNVMGRELTDGTRFLDNVKLVGPIPLIVADATSALLRNMRSASVVRGIGREDRYDYPVDVFRELLVNALMHRDYGPQARGTQVQIELYPDRLVVKSPGGVYGATRIEELGTAAQVSSSRNATLAQLLAEVDLPDEPGRVVSENRGSGLPRVVESLRQAGMSPPAFGGGIAGVTVTVPQHALLSVDTIEWIGALGIGEVTDAQSLALAMMRSTGRVTNGMLQAWGIDRLTAGAALRDLVARGIAIPSGGKRYASYRLANTPKPSDMPAIDLPQLPAPRKNPGISADFDAIRQAIRAGHVTARDIAAALGMDYHAVLRRLKGLRERGDIEQTRAKHSRSQSYRLVAERDGE